MKFWKPVLLTTLLFSAMTATILYSACEKDPCNNVTCYNGGSCGNGICQCPTGYENTQCQDKAVTRYLGTFAGYVNCNTPQEVIDTAVIYPDSSSAANINYVWVAWKSIAPTVLHGYVYNNQSSYTVVVPNVTENNYLKIYTISLQSYNGTNNKLTIQSYEKNTLVAGDTVINQCTFVGFRPHS